MNKLPWKPWHDVVHLRDDLKSGELSLSLFAADLYDVLLSKGAEVYREPEQFFALTYPTFNLRELAKDVVLRLAAPPDLPAIADFLHVTPNEVYGVATFYAQFRLSPQGRHVVKVCQGTACHVRGGRRILDTVLSELDTEAGGTTPDYKFTVERVACFGSCALAPVMVVDKDVFGRMTPARVKQLLAGE